MESEENEVVADRLASELPEARLVRNDLLHRFGIIATARLPPRWLPAPPELVVCCICSHSEIVGFSCTIRASIHWPVCWLNTRLSLKPRENVLIETFDVPDEMTIALVQAVRKAGGTRRSRKFNGAGLPAPWR